MVPRISDYPIPMLTTSFSTKGVNAEKEIGWAQRSLDVDIGEHVTPTFVRAHVQFCLRFVWNPCLCLRFWLSVSKSELEIVGQFQALGYRNYSFVLVYFIQYYAGNQGLVERPPKRSRPSLYMDHVNMAYVVQRIRKGYFSLDQGRASKTLD